MFKFALGVPSHLKPEDLLEVRVYDREYIGKNRFVTTRLKWQLKCLRLIVHSRLLHAYRPSPYATSRLLGLVKIYVSEYEVASGREWTTESSYPLRDEQDGITEVKSYVCAYEMK